MAEAADGEFQQHLVDVTVVGAAAVQQRLVVELGVADHREQRLGQVVVDVGVHAEEGVPQWWQRGGVGGGERDGPRAGWALTPLISEKRVQVEPSEGHVPALDPGRVKEPAGRDLGADRLGVRR